MSLLDLPPEFVPDILDYLTAHEFEQFALTCRRCYELLTPYIPRHNAYCRAWVSVDFCKPLPLSTDRITPGRNLQRDEYTPLRTVPELLVQISLDPKIASCIKHLDLNNGREVQQHWDHQLTIPERLAQNVSNSNMAPDSEHLSRLLHQSPSLSSMKLDDSQMQLWLNHLVGELAPEGDIPDYASAFLLSLLPNLESLKLPEEWEPVTVTGPDFSLDPLRELPGPTLSADLLYRVVQRANDASLPPGQALAKLTDVQYLCEGYGLHAQCGIGLITIVPFLALKSLRSAQSVYGTDGNFEPHSLVDGELTRETQAWLRYRPIGPNVEVLKLVDVAIEGEDEYQVLFQDMKMLRVLDLEYQMKDEVSTHFAPQEVMDVIMSAAGERLEVLKLTLGWDYMCWDLGPPLRNLHGLSKLKELELDTALFYEWPGEEDNEENDGEGRDEEEDVEEDEERSDQSGDNDETSDAGNESAENDDGKIENDVEMADEDDNDKASSTSRADPSDDGSEGDGSEDDEEDDSDDDDGTPKGCPSIVNLLHNSLDTLERLKIHVAALARDHECLKRLLHKFPRNTSRKCSRLQHLQVVLHMSDHFSSQPDGGRRLVEQAKTWLTSNVPDCEIEVVP